MFSYGKLVLEVRLWCGSKIVKQVWRWEGRELLTETTYVRECCIQIPKDSKLCVLEVKETEAMWVMG
jgi:hypothetical protein